MTRKTITTPATPRDQAKALLIAAMQALFELQELQADQHPELSAPEFVEADFEDIQIKLQEIERAMFYDYGVRFIEDGSTPTPEPEFA